jgi:peptidoglycan/xylan/chitin deacetylase (PgdA/CDA1 family)
MAPPTQRRDLVTIAPILMYHQVVATGAHDIDIHAVTAGRFAAQMQWLHAHGYQGTAIEELLPDGDHATTVRTIRQVAITFDDGYLDVFTTAFPILATYGFRATVFLVAGRIGARNDWDQPPAPVGAPLISWQQAQEMSAYGIGFGSHTMTHPDLTALPAEQAVEEIYASRQLIEEHLQQAVHSFAYPHSRWSLPIVQMVASCGYRMACTYVPGHVGGGGQRFLLQRTGILATDTLGTSAGKVQALPGWRLRHVWSGIRRALG